MSWERTELVDFLYGKGWGLYCVNRHYDSLWGDYSTYKMHLSIELFFLRRKYYYAGNFGEKLISVTPQNSNQLPCI